MIKTLRKAGWAAALVGMGFAAVALAQTPQTGAPFNLKDRNAGNKWLVDNRIDRTLQANTLIGFTGAGAIFRTASSDTVHQVSGSIPRYIFRLEYYGPKTLSNGKTSLSWSADYDINCRSKVSRIVATREYAAHNLSGEAVLTAANPNATYAPVAQDPIVKDVYDDICDTNGVSDNLGNNRSTHGLTEGLGGGKAVGQIGTGGSGPSGGN
jgi:hypothetical protein